VAPSQQRRKPRYTASNGRSAAQPAINAQPRNAPSERNEGVATPCKLLAGPSLAPLRLRPSAPVWQNPGAGSSGHPYRSDQRSIRTVSRCQRPPPASPAQSRRCRNLPRGVSMWRCCPPTIRINPISAPRSPNQWIDQDGVDLSRDGRFLGGRSGGSVQFARIATRCSSRPAPRPRDLTGKACTPNTFIGFSDTYMEARSTGGAMVKAGGDSWFFITAPIMRPESRFKRDHHPLRRVQWRAKSSAARLYPVPGYFGFFSAPLLEARPRGENSRHRRRRQRSDQHPSSRRDEFAVQKTMNLAAADRLFDRRALDGAGHRTGPAAVRRRIIGISNGPYSGRFKGGSRTK